MYGLSSSAILNDLERRQTQITRSRHYLTMNISETVRDTDIVRMNYEYGLMPFSRMSFRVT